jgi:hypothetical protein
MPFTIRQFRRLPACCPVTYNAEPLWPHQEIVPATSLPLTATS